MLVSGVKFEKGEKRDRQFDEHKNNDLSRMT